ncbi:3D domain-containing protein [Paenibacillus sanguinis]|uniref:3D domain-containing protein n=1 Tax=Paenibacillus sanguinis TaxID=225906 RepID=UPI0003602314|nr:3D domain-containing protein [Paenibacillus sanguinis]
MRQFRLRQSISKWGLLGGLLAVVVAADLPGYIPHPQQTQAHSEARRFTEWTQQRQARIQNEQLFRELQPWGMTTDKGKQVKPASSAKKAVETVKVMATGYTAGYESTGKKPSHPQYGITYSGVKVRRDKKTVSTIAADLKLFPIGTILYIPGYGYGVVADKGSAIRGHKIDLYFDTTKQVYKEWGKKEVEVQIVRKGSGRLTEAMLKELGQAMEVGKEIPEHLWEKAI